MDQLKTYSLIRLEANEKQTLGYLFDGLVKLACTLELPWLNNQFQISCIPTGIYTVVKRYSPKYGHHFHILDVPDRDYILGHHGNFFTDILGCVLFGNNHVDINSDGLKDVTSSKAKMKELNSILPDKFKLEIV